MTGDDSQAPEAILVKELILAAAPERRDDITALWATYGPQVRAGADRSGFHLATGVANLIVYTTRSMRQLWLLGFGGVAAMSALGGAIFCLTRMGRPFDPVFVAGLDGQARADAAFDETAAAARDLADMKDGTWPVYVPEPEAGRPTSPIDALAFDLTCMATAFTFLHEVQHIILKADASPLEGPDEELACDAYARTILLEQTEAYASSVNQNHTLVRRKRAMAIALAAFFVVWLTPPEAVNGTATHPALRARLDALLRDIAGEADEDFWIFVCSLIVSTLRRDGHTPQTTPFRSAKELALALMPAL